MVSNFRFRASSFSSPAFGFANVLSLLQSLVRRMKGFANVVLRMEIFQNTHPNPAIPAKLVPIPQPDPICLVHFVRRIVTQSHVPRQTDISSRSTKIKHTGVKP